MKAIKFPLNSESSSADILVLKTVMQQIVNSGRVQLENSQFLIQNALGEDGYKDFTRKLVATFQNNSNIEASGFIDEKTAAAINRLLSDMGVLDPGEAAQASVGGFIYMDYGVPANNLKVRLYSKGFGGDDRQITEVNTDISGKYQLPYDPAAITNANFEIRAVDEAGAEHSLSSTLFNVEKTSSAPINLIAPSAVKPVTDSEFTRLSKDLTGVLGNMAKLNAAQEKDDQQDITILSNATNWDARAIALASLSGRLSEKTRLSADVTYALVRAGLPTEADQLAQVHTDDVEKALELANAAGVVQLTEQQRKDAVGIYKTFANATQLTRRDFGSLSTYSELLNQQGLNENEQMAFASVYFEPRKNAEELWQKVRDTGIVSNDKIKSLQIQGKLGFLTANNALLASSLQGEIGAEADLSKLVSDQLYEPDNWDVKLKALAGTEDDNSEAIGKMIPPAYLGDTVADRKRAYVADMAAKVRTAFPVQVMKNRIETGKIVIGDESAKLNATGFLDKAESLGYKLGTTHLDSFVEANQEVLFRDAPEKKAETLESMKLLHRVYQVTPNDESMQVLMALGHKSAQDVIMIPQEDFVNRFATEYASKFRYSLDEGIRIGRQIYNKSHQVYATTYSLYTAAQSVKQNPNVFAISGTPERRVSDEASMAEKIKGAPNMQQLFGQMDFCECEHCHSVLSPAAYLVDLLQFLDRNDTDWQYFLDKWKTDHAGQDYLARFSKPYDALIDRRPDLINIPLTCENTNTALPYIDVVNEILEYYLVNKKLAPEVAHDTGNATTPELLAEPQNVEPKAYGILKRSQYPIGLPFDLWLETVREFCNYYEIPLWKVMETFQPVSGPDFGARKIITSEILGISPSEYRILTNEEPLPTLPDLYGYTDEAEMLVGLKSAKQLSNRLGISYKELLFLIKTRFINPQLDNLAVIQKMSLTINDIFRSKNTVGFTSFSEEEQKAFLDTLAAASTKFGVDITGEIEESWTKGAFLQIILLNDTNAACNFERTLVGYADRDATSLDWLKFNLFVRLWRKSGMTILETDRLLNVFIPKNLLTIINDPAATEAVRASALGKGIGNVLIQMANLKKLTAEANFGKDATIKISTLWTDIPSQGEKSLYSSLFLTKNVLKIDPVFDDALGKYLSREVKIRDNQSDHSLALQAALNLTADEIAHILKEEGQDLEAATLSMSNVSALYRFGLLAKALKISVSELISIKRLSGLNPFMPLSDDAITGDESDHILNQTLKFVTWASKIKASGFRLEDLNYLFSHQFDKTGKYRTAESNAAAVEKLLAGEITRIRSEHTLPVNPADLNDTLPFAIFTNDVIQQKLSLVVSSEQVQQFMAMWTGLRDADWNLLKDGFGQFLTEENFLTLFQKDAENADEKTKQNNALLKRATLAKALLPYIQKSLIDKSVTQILAAESGAEPALTGWLVTDRFRLHHPDFPEFPLSQIFAEADDPQNSAVTQSAYLLLNKTLQLILGFDLGVIELQYFLTSGEGIAQLNLNKLPVSPDNAVVDQQGLFKVFLRLSYYVTLRQELAGGTDDLINLLMNTSRVSERSDAGTAETEHFNFVFKLLADLSRRNITIISQTAKIMGIETSSEEIDGVLRVSINALNNEQGISRLWNALKLVQVFGIPVSALSSATAVISSELTDEQAQSIADNLKNAVKARYEIDSWQQIAQPIFDKLRKQRRDALVAYLLHHFRDLFGSMEDMYEYFLVDPGTEPIVQTSRIRIATSSIQLFIQRCFLNLENRWAKVPPSAINSKHWQWMNRYRVWEANRKIFLWPENWLEPEWRDDKTHLFKELEGKLLQGDVSNDLVEEAFFGYLKQMEELARLDIVATYCEEDSLSSNAAILHVIARTYGFPHKYFYRKYAQQMWTPWEPVDAEIDGNHIATIMWRGRLHIFWITFLEKITEGSTPPASAGGTAKLGEWSVSDALATVKGGIKSKTIEAHLHWTEFYKGKWTVKQSGGLSDVITRSVTFYTSPNDITINVSKEPLISDQIDGAIRINLAGLGAGFRLVNKNSSTETIPSGGVPSWPFGEAEFAVNRIRLARDYKLLAFFPNKITTQNGQQEVRRDPQVVLNKITGDANIVPCSAPVTREGDELGPMITPFFYQDSRNTFYVEPSLTETVTITEWDEWVGGPPVVFQPPKRDWTGFKIDPIVPWPKDVPIPEVGQPSFIDPGNSYVKVPPLERHDWSTNPGTYIKFGDRVVGKQSGLDVVLMDRTNNSHVLVKDIGQLKSVIRNNAGSGDIALMTPGNAANVADETLLIKTETTPTGVVKMDTGLVGDGGLADNQVSAQSRHLSDVFTGTVKKSRLGFSIQK